MIKGKLVDRSNEVPAYGLELKKIVGKSLVDELNLCKVMSSCKSLSVDKISSMQLKSDELVCSCQDEFINVINFLTVNNLKEKNIAKPKIFQLFNIRDIVFLAIISAVMILTCGVMPLVVELTKVVFGIAQLVTGFQIAYLLLLVL